MKSQNWIKWDVDSRSGVRMAAFFGEFGAVGYGAFLFFIEGLYRADDNKLGLSVPDYNTYAAALKIEVEHVRDIISALVGYGLLQSDEHTFWSDRVIEEIAAREEKTEEIKGLRSAAGKAGAAKRWQDGDGKAMASDGKTWQTIANDSNQWQSIARLDKSRSDQRREEKKEREEEEKETPPLGAYPVEVEAHAKNLPAKKSPPGWREGCEPGGEFGNVFMTPAEFDKLAAQFGQARVVTKIADLDAEIENGTKKYRGYKNHYATIAKWCRMDAARSRAGPPRIIGASTAATLENNLEFLKRNSKDPENESREIGAIIDGMFGTEKVIDCERSDGAVVAPSAARRS